MTRHTRLETEEREAKIQEAVAGVKSKRYRSANQAAIKLQVSKSVLCDRLNGVQPRNKAHQNQQHLLHSEERELFEWITALARVGYAARPLMMRQMAEHIRQRRVREINDQSIERVHYEEIGQRWVNRFMKRYPELQTIIPHLIEAGRVKDTSPEALQRWFDSIQETIAEYAILPENIYNMDESGFSIGTIEATRVIINKKIREYYQAHPGRQEWVTSVECICADGTHVPPLIIFKGENFSTAWLPQQRPQGWAFSHNLKGWTSNLHGMEWLRRCFEPATRDKAQGQWRLLINDGHDSHITGDWLGHCRENRIVPAILPPHSSHLTQPLDISIFGPLKKAMTREISPLLMTQVNRIHKIEWVSAYFRAHNTAFNVTNIQSAFSGAGLIPFHPNKVIHRISLPALSSHSSPSSLSMMSEPFNDAVLTSSPIDMNARHKANAALLRILDEEEPITPRVRNYIASVTHQNERLYARTSILQQQVESATAVLTARRENASGKRKILKGIHIITDKEVVLVREAEAETRQKKRRCISGVSGSGVCVGSAISNHVEVGYNVEDQGLMDGGDGARV